MLIVTPITLSRYCERFVVDDQSKDSFMGNKQCNGHVSQVDLFIYGLTRPLNKNITFVNQKRP